MPNEGMEDLNNQQKPEVEPEGVMIPTDKYQALLDKADRAEELEDFFISQQKKRDEDDDDFDLDALEGKSKSPRTQKVQGEDGKPVNFEEMSNAEIVKYVFDNVERIGLMFGSEIESLKIQREIDKCEAKYGDDFWDNYKGVMKKMNEVPKLSTEEAYLLVTGKKAPAKAVKKADEGEEESNDTKTRTSRTQKLLNLPSVTGERPSGVARGSTTKGGKLTLEDATNKAWEKVIEEHNLAT